MKTAFKIILLCILLCGGRLLAGTLEEEIGGYLSQLAAAQSLEQVDAIVQQANTHLDASRSGSSEVTRGFLQADILQARGRTCVNLWLRDKSDAALYGAARQSLLDSIDHYEQFSETADEDADRLARGLRGSAQRSSRWRNFAGYASRANYSRAWSWYALALLGDADKGEYLTQAMDYFEPFMLGGYRDNRIVQDCFLGYALCLFEDARWLQVRDLLGPARFAPDNTPPDLFKQVTLLRVRLHATLNSPLAVEWAGQLYFATRPADAGRLDPVEQQILFKRIESLARLAASPDSPDPDGYRSVLQACRRQLAGEAPQFNAVVTQLLPAAGLKTPLTCLHEATEAFAAQTCDVALQQIQAGLHMADPALELQTIADLEYLRCLCLNRLNRFSDVVRQVAAFLKTYPNDSRLPTLARIGLEAAIAAAKSGPSVVDAKTFDIFAAASDESPEMLTWYRAGFAAATGRFEEAESQLETIAPDSPVAMRCLYLKCFAVYQQSRRSDADSQTLRRAFDAAVEVGRISDRSAENWLTSAMTDLIIAVMTDCVRADLPLDQPLTIVQALDKLAPSEVKHSSGLLSAKILFLARYAEPQELRSLLDWLKTPDIEPLTDSLLAAAEILTADGSQPDRVALAAKIYSRVLEAREKTDTDVLWKLAESLRRAKRYDQAAERYRQILDADKPRVPVRVVRALALTFQAAEQYEKAAAQWKQMTRLTAPETNEWYESHYEQIQCTRLAGEHEKASQLLAYFRLKYPDPLPADWADSFAALEGGQTP